MCTWPWEISHYQAVTIQRSLTLGHQARADGALSLPCKLAATPPRDVLATCQQSAPPQVADPDWIEFVMGGLSTVSLLGSLLLDLQYSSYLFV